MKISFFRTLSVLFVFGLVSGASLDYFAAKVDASTAPVGFYVQGRWVTVPAGTRVLIRLSETLASNRQTAGSLFGGVLDTNVSAQGRVVAPRGTPVHGRIASASSAGAMRGSSHITLELTDIILNGTAHPIVTDSLQWQGQGSGGNTARNIGVGAGLGSAIGAVAGRGRGAAIGGLAGGALGTARSAGSPGQQVGLSQGTLLEFRLMQPASLPR